ncbi:MAG: hypothetical protein OQL19_06835 [Gammaproteobacteria bacterium]|nr:hypothetical protein [Gammaproteobacteria bacterium]
MKIYTDNKVDLATVSGTDATVNYPASNVQDPNIDLIYRGGEQVDFYISGSGSLKNISIGYINLVVDPTDLTTVNWSKTSSITVVDSGDTIQGESIYKLEATISAAGRLEQNIVVANTVATGKIRMRKGTNNIDRYAIYNTTGAATVLELNIVYSSKGFTISSGTIEKYIWLDDETVDIYFKTESFTNPSTLTERMYIGAGSSTSGQYSYYSTPQLLAGGAFNSAPFIDGTKAVDTINETFTMPDKYTVVWQGVPYFPYNTSVNKTLYEWTVSSDIKARLEYEITTDTFRYIWDDPNFRAMSSLQFDDGTSYTNLNQKIMIVCSVDTISGGISDSRMICIPLESGSISEDSTWSASPDIKSSTFSTLSIGNTSGANQPDSEYEYLRVYEGLLVGTVTSSDDVIALLKDKKLLLDKTYQEKFTATDLLIAGSTINDGDTITLRGNDVDSYGTGTPVDETVTWSKDIITHSFTKASHQYWRLSVNSSNIIDIGRIYLGENYETPGLSPTVTHDVNDNSIVTISASGKTYADIRYFNNVISIDFPLLTYQEKTVIYNIFRSIGSYTPIFVTFGEIGIDIPSIYGTINQASLSASLLNSPNLYSLSLTIRQEV